MDGAMFVALQNKSVQYPWYRQYLFSCRDHTVVQVGEKLSFLLNNADLFAIPSERICKTGHNV
jgi:hypothetical protein